MRLTMRSKIRVRWTSAPSDMGYGGTPTQWRTEPGELIGMRQAYRFPWELSRRIGEGVYRLIEYSHNGRPIERDEIDSVIAESEYYRGRH